MNAKAVAFSEEPSPIAYLDSIAPIAIATLKHPHDRCSGVTADSGPCAATDRAAFAVRNPSTGKSRRAEGVLMRLVATAAERHEQRGRNDDRRTEIKPSHFAHRHFSPVANLLVQLGFSAMSVATQPILCTQ
jgi:hypothetical protein